MKKRKATRNATRFLAVALLLTMLLSLAGCSATEKKDDTKEAKPTAEAIQEDTTDATDATEGKDNAGETSDVNTEQKDPNVPADQEEIDKALEESLKPTATPEPIPTTAPVEKMPTLEELIANSGNVGSTKDNFYMTVKFAADVAYEEDGMTIPMGVNIDAEMRGYEGSSYTKTYFAMTYLGKTEAEDVLEYMIADKDAGTATTYSYNNEEGQWYVSESLYIDSDDIDVSFITTDDIELDDLTEIVVTADDKYYYAEAKAVAGSETDGFGFTDSMGFGDFSTDTTIKFKFDKNTYALVSMDAVCVFDTENIDASALEEGISSMKIDDLIIHFELNTTPITVPNDVIKSAIEYSDYDDDIYTPVEPTEGAEDAIHKGWSAYYNSYNSKTGLFEMTIDDEYNTIDVTLNGKDNWYYDNQWSFGTYLAVRDDKICKDGPAYEVLYEDSDVKVNTTNSERAVADLLKKDYEEKYTSADIVPVTVNDRQCFVFESYRSKYSRTVSILQDIGFYTYVSIEIETEDLDTPMVSLAETFMLNFTYDGAQ